MSLYFILVVLVHMSMVYAIYNRALVFVDFLITNYQIIDKNAVITTDFSRHFAVPMLLYSR